MKNDRMRKLIPLITLLLAVWFAGQAALAPALAAQLDCTDEVCPIPAVNEANQPVYAIVSPVGYHAVEMIAQAPRLDTLKGKRIALVGGSFMAAVTHEELEKCILEKYPDAEIYLFQVVGSGGPYSVFCQARRPARFKTGCASLRSTV